MGNTGRKCNSIQFNLPFRWFTRFEARDLQITLRSSSTSR